MNDGYATVRLPEGQVRDSQITRWSTPLGQVTRWRGLVQSSHLPTARPDEARALAVALLAAADAAEAT